MLHCINFRKCLFPDVFLHFVIACKVDRVWPDTYKCSLFINVVIRGIWTRQPECVFCPCYTVNTSLTFDWIWRKLLHKPLELSTKRKLQKGAGVIRPQLLIEGVWVQGKIGNTQWIPLSARPLPSGTLLPLIHQGFELEAIIPADLSSVLAHSSVLGIVA